MKTKLLLTLTAILFLYSQCKKGDTGPQGTNGTTGPTGPTGSTGNANVISSIDTIPPGAWFNSSANHWLAGWNVNSITDVWNDVVLVYIHATAGGSWWALPTANYFLANDRIDYSYNTGTVNVQYTNASAPTVSITFKTVVIPPALAHQNPNVDYNDYAQVKSTFHIQD